MSKRAKKEARIKLDNLQEAEKELTTSEQKEVSGGSSLAANSASAMKDAGQLFQDMGSLMGSSSGQSTTTTQTPTPPSGSTK